MFLRCNWKHTTMQWDTIPNHATLRCIKQLMNLSATSHGAEIYQCGKNVMQKVGIQGVAEKKRKPCNIASINNNDMFDVIKIHFNMLICR